MTQYLVTGGAGFIGSHVVDHLVALGHQVRVLYDLSTGRPDRLPRHVDLVAADACCPEAMLQAARECTSIFHLAAIASVVKSVEDWVGAQRANQTATVPDAARRRGNLPVMFASSAAICGDQCPASEDLKPAPQQRRDFIFVDDVVRFLHAAMERLHKRPAHFVSNVCTGDATTILQLAELAAGMSSQPNRITHEPERTGDIRHPRGDPRTATAVLGVKAETPLSAGLDATMRWMKSRSLRAAS